MAQSLSIFDIALMITVILSLAAAAMWPLGRVRKPRSVSHCTYCDYDSARAHAGACSECGRQTGVPSRSRWRRLAWHLRWAMPAIVAGGWFTIETRHQGHAWWLLPNWAVIGLHDVVGAGVSKSLTNEFYAALIERGASLRSNDDLIKSLRLEDPVRYVWPRDVEPVGPSARLLVPATARQLNQIWPEDAPQLWLSVQAVDPDASPSESWQRWYPRPVAITTASEPETINVHLQIASPRSFGRRSLFNGFSQPELLLNRVVHSTRTIQRCQSIDELVGPLQSATADIAVQKALGLRLVTFADRWGLSLYPGPIDPEIQFLTVGVRLNARLADQIIASARFVVRMGPAGSSEIHGILPDSFVAMLDATGNPVTRESLEKPSVTFELITDDSMVLADSHAQRYWRGAVSWPDLASLAARPVNAGLRIFSRPPLPGNTPRVPNP